MIATIKLHDFLNKHRIDFGLSLHLHSYFVYTCSKGSVESSPAKWSRTVLECSKIILESSRTMF